MFSIGLLYLAIIACCYLFLWQKDRDKVIQSLRISRGSLFKLLPLLIAVFEQFGVNTGKAWPTTIKQNDPRVTDLERVH